jgi:integrase
MATRGCRPLTNEESARILQSFSGRHEIRNKALFTLGLSCGFRISELLSLNVGAVYNPERGHILDHVTVAKKATKGQSKSRRCILSERAKKAIEAYIQKRILDSTQLVTFQAPLFLSAKKDAEDGGMRALTRIQAHRIYKKAYAAAGVVGGKGEYGTHSTRKTVGQNAYEKTKDILKVQQVLGHDSVASTQKYIRINQAEMDNLVKGLYD